MKTICETLVVSRSNIIERKKKISQPAKKYRMPDDAWLLPMIRSLVLCIKRPSLHAASAEQINIEVDATLEEFGKEIKGGTKFLEKA